MWYLKNQSVLALEGEASLESGTQGIIDLGMSFWEKENFTGKFVDRLKGIRTAYCSRIMNRHVYSPPWNGKEEIGKNKKYILRDSQKRVGFNLIPTVLTLRTCLKKAIQLWTLVSFSPKTELLYTHFLYFFQTNRLLTHPWIEIEYKSTQFLIFSNKTKTIIPRIAETLTGNKLCRIFFLKLACCGV